MVENIDSGHEPMPPTGDSGDEPRFPGQQMPNDPAAEDAPLSSRVGRNPANLGDEVPEEADVTFPEPVLEPAEI